MTRARPGIGAGSGVEARAELKWGNHKVQKLVEKIKVTSGRMAPLIRLAKARPRLCPVGTD